MKTTRKQKKRLNPIGMIFSLAVLCGCLYMAFAYKDVAPTLLSRLHLGMAWPHSGSVVSVKLEASSPRTAFVVKGRTYLCGAGKLICYDHEGKALWQKAFFSNKPWVAELGNQLVVADLDVGDIYLMDSEGTILTKKLGLGAILDIDGRDGQMLVRLLDDKAFVVFDKAFKEVTRVPVPEGNLVAWDFSPSKALIGLLFIDSDKSDLFSNLQFYGYDGKLSEAVNVLGSALYDIRFTKPGVMVVGDTGVQSYAVPGGKSLWKQELPRTALGYAYNDEGMLAINTAGSDRGDGGAGYQNSLLVLDQEGKSRVEVENMDLEANMIRLTRDFTIVEGAGKLLIYDMHGKMVSMRMVGNKLKEILPLDDRIMLLIYEDKMEWVPVTL